jgi:hypothetical protein
MGKRKQKESEQELEAKVGWGKGKKNYYQEEDEEYSSLSEENAEGREIYEQRLSALNQQQFY